MKNRYIPFGYGIIDGELTVIEQESNAVKLIFESYLSGISCKELAEMMMRIGIRYREDTALWNKSMIKRILDNDRYIGTEGYPALIDSIAFHYVHKRKQEKAQDMKMDECEVSKHLKSMVFCTECSCVLKRKRFEKKKDKKRSNYYFWICSNECITKNMKITEAVIENIILARVNQLIDNPKLCEPERAKPSRMQWEMDKLDDMVENKLQCQDIQKETMKQMILQHSAMKYDMIDPRLYETTKIECTLAEKERQKEVDYGFITRIIKRILIDHQGEIQIELKNGVIL